MSGRRRAGLAVTALLAFVAVTLAMREADEIDATALVARAAADWARQGGDPAACVGVPEGDGIVVHCGTGAERRTYVPDGTGVRLEDPRT